MRYLPQNPPVFAMVDADPRFASVLVPHFLTIVIMDGPGMVNPANVPPREGDVPRIPKEVPYLPDGKKPFNHEEEEPYIPEEKEP